MKKVPIEKYIQLFDKLDIQNVTIPTVTLADEIRQLGDKLNEIIKYINEK